MRKIFQFFFISILISVLMPGIAVSQKSPAAPKPMQADAPKETLQGKIDYMEKLGGYFIRGENPGGEYFIVNQNPKVLKALKDKGTSVTIQGYTTNQGAEYFFIEKINGKKYKGSIAK